jgi:hypothetical protein
MWLLLLLLLLHVVVVRMWSAMIVESEITQTLMKLNIHEDGVGKASLIPSSRGMQLWPPWDGN